MKKVLKIIIIASVAISFFSWVVMMLWNHVLANISSVGLLNFWQAMGILVLSKILFGGFRGGWRGHGGPWQRDLKDKWQKMTPEERVQFKSQWKDRCRNWGNGRQGQKFREDEKSQDT